MHTFSFENGDTMSKLGLGTWKSAPDEVYEAVKTALHVGYRHIDCSPIYKNEAEVGAALSETFEEGSVNRDEVWVTSKLWNDAHAPEDVRPALTETLNDLQLETIDLYLMHWPVALKPGTDFPTDASDFISLDEIPLSATWNAMEALKDEGLAQHIGVSNFSPSTLESLLQEADEKPEVNQVEMHPYLQQPELVDFADRHGIHVTAYSPLGSKDRPDTMKSDDDPVLLEDPTIESIAERHDATPAQVLIGWAVQRGTAVIPKSSNPDHIEENLAAARLSLSEEDMDAIARLDRAYRYLPGEIWTIEGSSYTQADLWDE